MKLVMIGSGYVGLVSGACFADFGHDVICVDKLESRIDSLRNGVMPIFEPGLEPLVAANVKAGRLRFSTDLASAVAQADAVFIAVGTPSRRGDGHADLSYVYDAAREIARAVTGFTVIITKSTVPVGTGDAVEDIFRATNPAADIAVVSNPEFLREGAAISDFKRPDRVVIGTTDPRAMLVMRDIYRPLSLNEAPLMFCERRSSELIKYAANAYLAMKVTFINEIADLCEQLGTDVQKVATGIGLDKRIGGKFLHAGPGYGGSCFPKDTAALVKIARDCGSPMRLVETTIAINDARKPAMVNKIIAACDGDVKGKKIAILGLTFKPNTDDMREAPSLAIIAALQALGAIIAAYDPTHELEGLRSTKSSLKEVHFGASAYQVADGACALVLVTEWDAFRALDFSRLKEIMNKALLVDLRNVYPVGEVTRHGFRYVSVGRPTGDA